MEDGPAPPWVFSNRVLDEAVLALQQDKIPTAEQMAALHGAANPSAPPARAPKPSNFTPPPPRASRRWEDFTYTNESGRVCMREDTAVVPHVTIKGQMHSQFSPPSGSSVSVGEYASKSLSGARTPSKSMSLPKLGSPYATAAPGSVRAGDSELRRRKAAEARAFKELASMRRAVQSARAQVVQHELRERRAAERAAYDRKAFHDKFSAEGVGKPPLRIAPRTIAVTVASSRCSRARVGTAAASEAEVLELSEKLNAQMAHLELDPAKRSWFKLFKHMDDDGSGRVRSTAARRRRRPCRARRARCGRCRHHRRGRRPRPPPSPTPLPPLACAGDVH